MNPPAALITGGSKGIGLEAVRRFQSLGYRVVTCARSKAVWEEQVSQYSALGGVDFRTVDLTVDGQVADFFAYVESQYATLKVAVNNASPKIAASGPFAEDQDQSLLTTLLNNLWLPALCLKHELPLMEDGGSIINISSVNGLRPSTNSAMYSTAKHGLEGLTRSLALEAISKGIRINAVAPGATWTPRWEERERNENPTIREDALKVIPAGRFATPSEIVNAIEWLCSEKAAYVVGHTLVIDGGLSLT